jgi:hypothetical protein
VSVEGMVNEVMAVPRKASSWMVVSAPAEPRVTTSATLVLRKHCAPITWTVLESVTFVTHEASPPEVLP